METIVLIGVILAVALVMASGVWVGSVLIAAVARVQRPASSTPTQTAEKAGP